MCKYKKKKKKLMKKKKNKISTHESENLPILVWEFFKDEEGNTMWQYQPRFKGDLSVNQFDVKHIKK
jgi:hypothetical protein